MLTLGKQQKKTKVKNEAGKRPVWNENFTFSGNDNILKVKVMDEDTVTDDTVGEGSVDLGKFRNNPSEQQCTLKSIQNLFSFIIKEKQQAEFSL